MASQEAEALGVLLEQHLAEVAMAKANLTSVSDGSGDAECLQAFADCCSSLICLAAVLLDGDGCADGICPLCVLKADGLNALNKVIDIKARSLGDLLALLDGGNAILLQYGKNLGLSSLI